jgi:hypothetical protein
MRRSGFSSKLQPRRPVKQIEGYTPRPRAVAVAVAGPARATVALPKRALVRDERYRRLVASLPCILCGVEGRSQAAHPNVGKAKGAKADDLLCFPLCADQPGTLGCHARFDQHQLFPRDMRASIEARWAQQTAEAIATTEKTT